MKYSLLMQIVLIGASLAIVFTYIIPKFEETKLIQDDLLIYTDAVAKASEYNKRLGELIAIKNSFPQDGLQDVTNFIPATIDEVKVMHDLESIFSVSEVSLLTLVPSIPVSPVVADVAFEGGEEEMSAVPQENPTAVGVTYQDFKMSFMGTYAEVKKVLTLIESNAALLEVTDFSLKPEVTTTAVETVTPTTKTEDQKLSITVSVRAFGLTASKQ